jgi:hypothetical protein
MREKSKFASGFNADSTVQSSREKFHFCFSENYGLLLASRLDTEGVLANRHRT